ncbi:hypothetical protein DY000_02012991 [Brassica cretica]|uniref:Uncharacterized protein n=1 Tax=Brassica cretica TaxID=69181 RepID=A0ABQ7D6G4_BRACR|nr:hypothetical protein DY000_02012991 [Brassica cretica]
MTATRSNDDGDKIERRQRRDRATATRSSVSSLTKQMRSSDDVDEIEQESQLTQVGDDFKLGRWRSFHSSLSHVPDTHGRSLCSSYESQNPASTHFLRSTMIAEYIPFSSDKRNATTQVKAPPQLQITGAVRVSTVLVRDIWVFEKSLFHTGACWRLCGRIEFLSKDIIQPAL